MKRNITPKELSCMRALIRTECANEMNGSCLLLDDGEEHCCPQLISRYGIYCRYFENCVLPADRELYKALTAQPHCRNCACCGKSFIPMSNRQQYCPECGRNERRRQDALRKHRKYHENLRS